MREMMLAAAIVGLSAGAGFADPIEGIWQTQPDEGSYAHINMGKCGPALCGTIARSFNSDGEFKSENQGKNLVFDMVPNGDGTYSGKVWRPANNKVYIGKMDLNGNKLSMKGCVAGGLICKKQTWTRVQ